VNLAGEHFIATDHAIAFSRRTLLKQNFIFYRNSLLRIALAKAYKA
jgi:hypothetical protein